MHLESIINLLVTYRYVMLLVLSLIEGPLVCLGAGIMIRLGYFAPLPAFIIVIIGDIVPNSVSFFLGKFSNKKTLAKSMLAKLNVNEKHFEMLEKFWVTHTHKTMFLAKLAWGLGMPLFMSAGMTTLSFKKFLESMTWVAIVQYIFVISLGYYLANSYASVTTSDRYIEIIGIFFSFVIIIAGMYYLSKFAREKMLDAE